jgi:phosphoribosylanthranilate isomerase
VNRASGPLPDAPREDSCVGQLQRPRVKFCGITRREDAVAAADLGADAVGFVLWPGSPRYVSPDAARDLVRALPSDLETVGVFVGVANDDVTRAAGYIGLSAVQVYGEERLVPEERTRLVIKPVKSGRIDDGSLPETAGRWPDDVVLLVDAVDPVRHGGTGQLANWRFAAKLAELRPIILAGGLNVKNVIEAIHGVMPFGLDVSSGIESAPGVKDLGKMREFLWTAKYAWSCLPSDWHMEWLQRVQFRGAEPRGLRNPAGLTPKVRW